MKNIFRIVSILLAVCLIAFFPQRGYAAPQNVKLIVNGEELKTEGVNAYYDDAADVVFVPAKAVADAAGVKADVNNNQRTVTVTCNGVQMKLICDNGTATVGNEQIALKAAPVMKEDTVYIPAYLFSEYFDFVNEWNADALTFSMRSATALQLELASARVSAIFGEASRTAVSERGYRWWIYNDLKDYRMIGIEDDKVVAYYLHSTVWTDISGLKYGMTKEECAAVLKPYSAKKYGSYTVYSGGKDKVTVFYDGSGIAYAMLRELLEYSDTIRISASVLEGFAQQFEDLVNVERAQKGLSALVWDNAIAEAASIHTSDMAKNNIYSHEGSDGSTPSKRLETAGFDDFYEIEIISRAFPNALTAFSAHLNNEQYCAVMEAGYAAIGAAAAYNPQSDGLLYYTQIFYADK